MGPMSPEKFLVYLFNNKIIHLKCISNCIFRSCFII